MQLESLREAWKWAVNSEQADMWQMLMALTALVATPFAGFIALEYFQGRRKDREEALEKRHADEEALQVKRDEIDGDLLELYIGVLDDFIRYPELYDAEGPLTGTDAIRQKLIYEKLNIVFATAFRRLYGEKDPLLEEKWFEWEDLIGEWVAKPNFRRALPDLMDQEAEAFIKYMERKLKEIPELSGQIFPPPPSPHSTERSLH